MAENDFWVSPKDIPLDLNLMRYAGGDPVGEQLRVYTLTGLNTNFARPCFALAPRGDATFDDVAGALEETLHRILDAGGTPEDVYRVMGLVMEDTLDEDTHAYGEYLSIDLGYCTCGLLDGWETVPDAVARVTNVVTDRQLMHFERAYDAGLPLKDAMRLAKAEYDGFQADMVIETLLLADGQGDGYLTASDRDALVDPSRTADEMHALLEVARDYGDVSDYLGFSGDDPRETAERVVTSYRLSRLVGERSGEDVQLSPDGLSRLSLPQLYAAYGALIDGKVPAELAPALASPAVTPETTENVYRAFASGGSRMSAARAQGILKAPYAPEQQAFLLSARTGLSDEDFFRLFATDVPADKMRVMAHHLDALPAHKVEALSATARRCSAPQLDVVLSAAENERVPDEVADLIASHPELSTLEMREVVTSAEHGADFVEIAAKLGHSDDKEASPVTMTAETRDMASAKDALTHDATSTREGALTHEEK